MRLADHQPQWAELEAAGGISAKPAIRRRVGAARRSAGAAGAALLRRQQGAVVRDHRRPAAISGIFAGVVALHPPLQGEGCDRPTGPARSGRPDGRLRCAGWGCAGRAPTSPPAALCAASLPLAGEASSSPLTTAAAETTCPKPCAATGVSRDDPDNGSKGGAEQKEGAAVERREARPPPHLPPPRERCGGGMPRPKRRRRRRRLRGAESAQRLPALRSRRYWGAIRFLLLATVRPRQHSSGAHASRE